MNAAQYKLEEILHESDVCVVGGGMAGITTAISAARHGAQVVLMHDRPVYGGNASSECRVHVCGADRHNSVPNMRETGILEELRMANLYRNPNRSFSVWDTVLYDAVVREENITPLLNCSCMSADVADSRLRSVVGLQTTTQTFHRVDAEIFVDCSGDAVLAPLAGAQARIGREAQSEYGESIAPEHAYRRTMGMTCLFQTREYESVQPFEPPEWARRYDDCEELPYGARGHRWWHMGYWWVELGGEQDSIRDTEKLRDRLLKIAFGVWDHIKNRCPHRDDAERWALEWVQFLPGKRESRRYVAHHMLTQLDIEAGGLFEDVVAYGGWAMDDHNPAGFHSARIGAPATVFYPTPSPYGIPLRSLYSRNIPNLMFAGRDAGCTHAAMSSTRVMGTGCSMGQAVGTAAALAVSDRRDPADMANRIDELQQILLQDDAYLPGVMQRFKPEVYSADLTASAGDPSPLRDGVNRPTGTELTAAPGGRRLPTGTEPTNTAAEESAAGTELAPGTSDGDVGLDLHAWICRPGDWVAYTFDSPLQVSKVTVVAASGLDLTVAMSFHQPDDQLTAPPDRMPKSFGIDGLSDSGWQPLIRVNDNHQRLRRFDVDATLQGLRFSLDETWGGTESRLYAFYFE